MLSDLTPGTQYNVAVRAFTVAFGPFSDQLTLHTADGEDMQMQFRLYQTIPFRLYIPLVAYT